ncbi:cell wall hydrolase [Paenibacillus sp. R14(2021)]|uniref:cell wall hydrolase n=1 Tax=Paenibacillus sp. R14(2021) TaxID=2859228 RepID=UPI001C614240|nr:cell wall hydrolase [Paenibacillus sp. R14(2021)]
MLNRLKTTSVLFAGIAAAGSLVSFCPAVSAAAQPTLRAGSHGGDVADMQFRLQTLGYYKAPVTSTYSMITRNAVSKFQRACGLPGDGIAGPLTWRAIKKVTVNKADLAKLARIIYSESRGESYKGQVAVGAVVMNRLHSTKFPKTITNVIMAPSAFAAVQNGQYWLIPDAAAFQAARDAARGWDPTSEALYYYNPAASKSKWVLSLKVTAKIGNHVFAR